MGLELASLLDAQESIPWLLQFAFNVHGRVRPYNKWLEWELREHPLPCELDLPLVGARREQGHGGVIDGWEPDVAWLRGDQ